MKKLRGFEVVADKYRKHSGEIILPRRGTNSSACYDIHLPIRVCLAPNERKVIDTDLKAFMQSDERLNIYIRSSIGIKKGVVLTNQVSIIDSDYYNNPDNDGNIKLAIWNMSDETVVLEKDERIAQGEFSKYLTTWDDNPRATKRIGGIGSTGRK